MHHYDLSLSILGLRGQFHESGDASRAVTIAAAASLEAACPVCPGHTSADNV